MNKQLIWVEGKYHGLYGSTSCCISHGPCQWKSLFSTIYSSETPRPIFIKLEVYNYFSDSTQHAKFQGAMSTWAVWPNSLFDAWKFLSFFLSSSRPQIASLDTSPHTIRHYTSFPPRKCLLGVRKMKFEICPPPFIPQKRKKFGL